MIRICLVTDNRVPPAVRYYRTQGVFWYLSQATSGLFHIEHRDAQEILAHEMNVTPYNIVIIERAISVEAHSLIHVARAHGVLTWGDYDDDLFNVPDYNDAQDFYDMEQNRNLIQRIMADFDVVTVSTEALRKLYSGLNPNTITINNAWNHYRLPMQDFKELGKPIRMAWRGSSKHYGDLKSVKAPILKSMQDPAFAWGFFGYRHPDLNIPRKNYRKWTGLADFYRVFFSDPPDFLLVPLVVNAFNKGKSNISYLEATVAGAVTIAPMGLPEFDRPGVIQYKDAKHLDDIFNRIKSGKIDKRERLEAARADLEENYRLDKINRQRAEVVASMFGVELSVGTNIE